MEYLHTCLELWLKVLLRRWQNCSVYHSHLAIDQRGSVMCICFVIQKDFDSIPHLRLMSRLSDLHVNSLLLSWLQAAGTNSHVVRNGDCSTTLNVLSSVLQGWVLGPLLFLIYVDTIFSIYSSLKEQKFPCILIYKPIVDNSCFFTMTYSRTLISSLSGPR